MKRSHNLGLVVGTWLLTLGETLSISKKKYQDYIVTVTYTRMFEEHIIMLFAVASVE